MLWARSTITATVLYDTASLVLPCPITAFISPRMAPLQAPPQRLLSCSVEPSSCVCFHFVSFCLIQVFHLCKKTAGRVLSQSRSLSTVTPQSHPSALGGEKIKKIRAPSSGAVWEYSTRHEPNPTHLFLPLHVIRNPSVFSSALSNTPWDATPIPPEEEVVVTETRVRRVLRRSSGMATPPPPRGNRTTGTTATVRHVAVWP